MIPVEEARERVLNLAREERFRMPVETVDLFDAVGRVAARDLTSDIDVTPFDNTAMDGFAIVASSVESATADSPIELEIIDWVGAGAVSDKVVAPGQAIRIMTGAIMPEGADAVVKIEDTAFTEDGGIGQTVCISAPVTSSNIRKAGEEAKAGDVVVHKDEVIRPATIGLLASTGNMTVDVYARPKVGILSIGSELIAPPAKPEPGKIRDANSFVLGAYARELGCEVVIYPIVADDEESIRAAFEKAIAECDFVVSSGGASNGDFDYAIETVRNLGDIVFDCVNVRPGKAQAFGSVGNTLVEVLSGNPAAAAVGFQLFARPALRAMQGFAELDRPVSEAILSEQTRKKDKRQFYQRAHLEKDENGKLKACQERSQSSALLSEMKRSSVLVELPPGTGLYEAGAKVRCIHLDIDEGVVI